MSPGSTTSGAFGSTAPAGVVAGIDTVVGAGTAVDVGNSVAGGDAVVEGLGTVVALCTVADGAESLTTAVEFDELLEPLHADATKARAIPAAAIFDLMRIMHFLLA